MQKLAVWHMNIYNESLSGSGSILVVKCKHSKQGNQILSVLSRRSESRIVVLVLLQVSLCLFGVLLGLGSSGSSICHIVVVGFELRALSVGIVGSTATISTSARSIIVVAITIVSTSATAASAATTRTLLLLNLSSGFLLSTFQLLSFLKLN